MKYSTAVKIVNKLGSDKPVPLRKGKHGGISSPTWCMICNVFLDQGFSNVEYRINNVGKLTMMVDEITLNSEITLY
jgi:hypothetical protein